MLKFSKVESLLFSCFAAFTITPRSATAVNDYVALTSSTETVTFMTSGDTEETLMIDIVSDALPEGTEQFQVEISVTSGTGSIGDLGKASVFVYDNDNPGRCHVLNVVYFGNL